MLEGKSYTRNIGGRNLTLETGKLAEQAEGAVTIQYGETVALVTVGVSKKPREGVDFLPLTIDTEERAYAAGKIPGGFIRREGRPSEHAILTCRLTDRPIRPLLPKNWRREIQVIITVLSADQENDSNLLGIIGASAALGISSIPFEGPISAVRVGYIDGELVLNPTFTEMEQSSLELVMASTADAVVMVESGAKEVPEELMFKALRFGHEANQDIIAMQRELVAEMGKPKVDAPESTSSSAVIDAVRPLVADKLADALLIPEKRARRDTMHEIEDAAVVSLAGDHEESAVRAAYEDIFGETLRRNALDKGVRIAGRKLTEIRELACEVGLLPRTHGSAIFQRGQTQVLTITTLGSLRKEQQIDDIGPVEVKRFMHHYNFPPYATGETKRVGTPGRREIGHGALVEKALTPVLPADGDFPYTVRLVSDVLGSNGSSSQASVCASSMSMMDAGIPIKRPVAGIAMGLMIDEGSKYAVLTDIEGDEDHYGDMDFKVAGTTEGITALQLDIKVKGITFEMMETAINQAKAARFEILGVMDQTINATRTELSDYAPRMYKVQVDADKIGGLIGPGGRTIRAITEQTKTTIDIESDGTVFIGSPNAERAQQAMDIINGLTKDVEVGTEYTGKVSRVMNFGAMVEILPGKEGLIHISELANYRVGQVEDVVKIGDEVKVKVIEIDSMNRINLSRRVLLDDYVPSDRPAQSRDSRPPRRDDRGPRGGGGFDRPRPPRY